jgi:hypothetical protein
MNRECGALMRSPGFYVANCMNGYRFTENEKYSVKRTFHRLCQFIRTLHGHAGRAVSMGFLAKLTLRNWLSDKFNCFVFQLSARYLRCSSKQAVRDDADTDIPLKPPVQISMRMPKLPQRRSLTLKPIQA